MLEYYACINEERLRVVKLDVSARYRRPLRAAVTVMPVLIVKQQGRQVYAMRWVYGR
jgi:hypothetical protein